jgi:CRP/FNR family transcriptional regulator, cyclic AMP receptor protein
MTLPIVQKLIRIPICRGLTERQGTTLYEVCEERTAAQGEVLFREGEPGDCLYFVMDGDLSITKQDPSGQPQLLAHIRTGDVVGEMSLLGTHGIRSATATADSETALLMLSAVRFRRLLQTDDVAALKIVYNLAQVMSARLRQVNDRVVSLLEKGNRKQELTEFQKVLSHWSF